MKTKVDYKYNEGTALAELQKYIDSTYDEHYSKNKFQATEFIIDGGHGEGFCIGNIMKYAQRYGKKGGKNRSDLLKVVKSGGKAGQQVTSAEPWPHSNMANGHPTLRPHTGTFGQ